jgi:hypothetical protein
VSALVIRRPARRGLRWARAYGFENDPNQQEFHITLRCLRKPTLLMSRAKMRA